jgi:hypothetical protein
LLIDPNTEIVYGNLGGLACLKTLKCRRAFALKAERVGELVIDRLDHLAEPREPAAAALGPGPGAVAFGRAEPPTAVLLNPSRMIGHHRTALGHYVWALGGRTRSPPLGLQEAAEGQERVGQALRLRAGSAQAQAREPAHGGASQEQVTAVRPSQPSAPAAMRQPRQPAQPAALGSADGHASTLQGFVRTLWRGSERPQREAAQDQRRLRVAQLPVKLGTRGQAREGRASVALGRARKATLPAQRLPLSADRQRQPRTATEGRMGTWMRFSGPRGFTAISNHDLKGREEGVDIDHSHGSLSWDR